jgi:hypothetical protein
MIAKEELNIFKDKYQEMTFENNQEIMDMTMKTAYEILALPITNIIVKWVKKHEQTDTYDNEVSYNPLKISEV